MKSQHGFQPKDAHIHEHPRGDLENYYCNYYRDACFFLYMSQNGAGKNILNILKLTYWLYFSRRSMHFHSISLVAMFQSFPRVGDFATKFHSACSLLQWTTPLRSTHLIRHTCNKTHGNTMKQIDTNICSFLWNWSVKLVIWFDWSSLRPFPAIWSITFHFVAKGLMSIIDCKRGDVWSK